MYTFVTRVEKKYPRAWIFLAQYKSTQNLQISQGYIFYSLQHFTAKLCSFTKFKMGLQAVEIFLPLSNFLKSRLQVKVPLDIDAFYLLDRMRARQWKLHLDLTMNGWRSIYCDRKWGEVSRTNKNLKWTEQRPVTTCDDL